MKLIINLVFRGAYFRPSESLYNQVIYNKNTCIYIKIIVCRFSVIKKSKQRHTSEMRWLSLLGTWEKIYDPIFRL